MIKTIQKYKDYLYVGAISLAILLIIFLCKGIYPFGRNSLVYGDMQEQIASYYYYLYDCFHGNGSFFINFTSSGGISFFGIIAYYLLNPLSLFVLFVKRSDIYLFLSIIVLCKIILCNLTCLYALKKTFPNKNSYLSIFLALLYGFSIYSLNYYQITGWIDVMYLFPLVFVGFKRLLDGNSPKMYFIILTLSLYFQFYLTAMVIIFLFLLTCPYLRAYGEKKERGKRILSLGISTVLSMGSALVIILPTLYQISISSRVGYSLESLLNSKMGPFLDKTSLFLFGPILFVGLLLLIKNFRSNKKFLSFYIPSMILLLLPVVVEPIHKLLHFGSYASFPYRFGFITVFFLIIGAHYAFLHEKSVLKKRTRLQNILSVGCAGGAIICMFGIAFYRYEACQKAIESLTFSRDKITFVFMVLLFLIAFIASLFIFIIQKGFHRFSSILLASILLTHIFITSYLYLGIDFVQKDVEKIYTTLSDISKDASLSHYYRYKNEVSYLTNNGGNVTGIPTLDHFSSLTKETNQQTLKQLGYSSYWTRTTSYGGTLFTDILLGNKYVLTEKEKLDGYHLKAQYNDLFFFEYEKEFPYGFIITNDVESNHYTNTFELQNAIYHSMGEEKDLFTVEKKFETSNLTIEDGKIITEENATITFPLSISGKKHLYLELYKSLVNKENEEIYHTFSILINGKPFLNDYPNKDFNGVVDLGVFEEDVTISLIVDQDCEMPFLSIGLLDLEELERWLSKQENDMDITFSNNEITLSGEVEKDSLLFLPVPYDEGYKATRNGKEISLTKVYQNYLGVPLSSGKNTIRISFTPKYLPSACFISVLCIILAILLFHTNAYSYLLQNGLFRKMANGIYLFLYGVAILFLYLLPILCFFLSFIMKISI